MSDLSTDIDESSHFERLLIELDAFNPEGAATRPIAGAREDLLLHLEAAVERMVRLGGDRLRLELVLDGALGWNAEE